MRKITLVAVIIVAVAMIIGAQSALAAKPATPVTGIANGQVAYIHSSDFSVGPTTDVSGPWKLILHLNKGTINFSATCQTSVGVVKVSAIGPASWSIADDVVTVTGVTFTIKSKGVTHNPIGTITVSASDMMVDFGYPGPTRVPNVRGDVNLFKGVP